VKYNLTTISSFGDKETIHCEFDVSGSDINWLSGTVSSVGLRVREVYLMQGYWQCDSVVRTLVSGRRTFPDLRLITHYDPLCLLWVSQPWQLSLPFLRGSANE